jgi:hypothetical protein
LADEAQPVQQVQAALSIHNRNAAVRGLANQIPQIEFLEWTDADHMRHSKFVGMPEDKSTNGDSGITSGFNFSKS